MDGIERDTAPGAKVVRIDLTRPSGREIGSRYGVEFVPAFLIFDRRGQLVAHARVVDGPGFTRRLRELAAD